jgi:oxepin-CoA hydrolase/3-oxo-5,6-dehydrosuberyl-CoA semialdehyde dehydrogenase
MANGGNTRGDAKFDIDGASGTLAAYADVAAQLGAVKHLADGEGIQLTRSARFFGQHVLVPREGVAVHVNAFNFPAWGFAEKAAVALLAGMPVISKPATATALLTYKMMELIVDAKILPAGALSFLAGSAGDLLHHLGGQDVLAFTGSLATASELRALPNLHRGSVHVNIEADSLNAAVLAPDAERGTPTWDLFIADVVKEMTQKTGQKCTAIRRVMVPEALADAVTEDLSDRLAQVKVGDPASAEVTMGPLSTASQLRDWRDGLTKLRAEAESVFGGDGSVTPITASGGAPTGKGFFVSPVLLRCNNPEAAESVNTHEVFGPAATICVYDGSAAKAANLVSRGGGMLVTSVYGDDRAWLAEAVRGIAPWVGRLFLGSAKIAGQSVPPGLVLPQLVHGGPGRAGGGEELGGPRGLSLYLQRTALQGDKPILEFLARGEGKPAQ